MEVLSHIPQELINFLLVVLFSLLIGLEQRRLHIDQEFETLFGTDRTITLIGILGYILYSIMPESMALFYGGALILAGFLGVYYYHKIRLNNKWGFTSIVIALITYCLAPLIARQPSWLVLMVVVTILVIVEIKESLLTFSRKFDSNEFTQLAKFITIAGIILPLLSNQPVSAEINISPYQIWLSIVAVSGISYLSYILRKFVFLNSGIIASAMLGGLYSSTVTTIILAKKSRQKETENLIAAGIFGATGMMYFRILMLAALFNTRVAIALLPYLVALAAASGVVALIFMRLGKASPPPAASISNDNPLEFKTALIFGVLFSVFAVVTSWVIARFGIAGINILSFIVGVTDIDPYILNLFQHKSGDLAISIIVTATLIATTSNNLGKMIYAMILGNCTLRTKVAVGFAAIILVSIVALVLV